MGRCGGWSRGIAVALAFVAASCGGTGGGPSDSGKPLVFQARGRLNLIAQPTNDPRVLTLIATLLDPQGVPFRNQPVTFTAEFQDATFIPGNDNQGSALTNDAGQARVTLVAGLTTGQMRVTAEAPPALNISTAITVEITAQGFVSRGDLGIIPSSVTFVNPLVGPDVPGPMTIFNATGGTPPYRWNNSNKSLGRIVPIGIPNVNEQAEYTLIGPIPTEVGEALQDTVTLQDAAGDQTTATVLVIFAECTLALSATEVNFGGAVGGEQFDIVVTNGVPPFTATHTFPESGDLSVNQQTGTITFTVATPPLAVAPDTILIRDSRGCTGIVEVTITPAPGPTVTTIVLEANPLFINGITGGTSTITATVLDETNQPIPNLSVLFTDDNVRATTDPLTATTDSSGRAVTTLRVPPLTPAGIVRVTGSARGVSGFVNVAIITPTTEVGGPPADIFVDLFANGSGNNNDTTCTTVLSALVVDAEGNPVNDGTRVDWEAPPPASGGIAVVAISSPSFTGQAPPTECNLSPFLRDLNIEEITPQPGDALTCLKYPRSLSATTIDVTATATGQGATVRDTFPVILPPCPFTPTGLAITPAAITLSPGQSQQFVITGGLPPYQVTVNGGTVGDPPAVTTTVDRAGGSFIYTAGTTQGEFSIIVTDANNRIQEATVNIEVATLPVSPEEVLFCDTVGGETARITLLAGVPPFTATHTFNTAGVLRCEETNGEIGESVTCMENSLVYIVQAAAPSVFNPDSVVIQDSEGKAVTVSVVINGGDCETPQEATLTLTANPTSIPVTGTSSIQAVLSPALSGVPISFSTNPSGIGNLSSSTVNTNSNGQAIVTLTGNSPGAVTVTAETQGGEASDSVEVTVTP